MRATDPSADRLAAAPLLVPNTLLAHDLGTPLNVLKGYTRLLATGRLGPLDHDAVAAVEAMDEAVGRLAGTLELLTGAALDGPGDGASSVDLEPVLLEAARAQGLSLVAADGFALKGAGWRGWDALFRAAFASVLGRGVETVSVVAGDSLVLAPTPARVGSGDEALAAWLATAQAERAGLGLDLLSEARLCLRGAGLQAGHGRLELAVPAARKSG